MDDEIIEMDVGPHRLRLAISDNVFAPNLTTQLLAKQVKIPAGSAVLDVGCGVGPVAIAAAKSGAKTVCAVDIMAEACELARHNVELNGVADRVQVLQGDLFEPVAGKQFDVIIDDVSGIADEVARMSPWYPHPIPAGGADGTVPTIRMLKGARQHLTPGGCLYFPTISLANAPKIVAAAKKTFGGNIEQVFQKHIPLCPELKAKMDELKKLRDLGAIDFLTRRGKHLWTLTIFKAQPLSAV